MGTAKRLPHGLLGQTAGMWLKLPLALAARVRIPAPQWSRAVWCCSTLSRFGCVSGTRQHIGSFSHGQVWECFPVLPRA